jgi:uncharacterized membrane protein YkvA (DUF1232 family)
MTRSKGGSKSKKEMMDFYQKLRHAVKRYLGCRRRRGRPAATAYDRLVDLLALLPDLFHLSVRLLFDKNVPSANKGALVAGIAYVVSPIDLIPEAVVGPVGYVDDLVVMAMALNKFLETDNSKVRAAVRRYWAGEQDVFDTVKHILEVVDEAVEFLPKKIIRMIRNIFA